MLSAFRIDKTLNKKGSCPPYRLATSGDISIWLSCTISSSVRWLSTSRDGSEGCVPIHSLRHSARCKRISQPSEPRRRASHLGSRNPRKPLQMRILRPQTLARPFLAISEPSQTRLQFDELTPVVAVHAYVNIQHRSCNSRQGRAHHIAGASEAPSSSLRKSAFKIFVSISNSILPNSGRARTFPDTPPDHSDASRSFAGTPAPRLPINAQMPRKHGGGGRPRGPKAAQAKKETRTTQPEPPNPASARPTDANILAASTSKPAQKPAWEAPAKKPRFRPVEAGKGPQAIQKLQEGIRGLCNSPEGKGITADRGEYFEEQREDSTIASSVEAGQAMSRNKARNGSSKEENEEELAMWAQIRVTVKKLSGIQRRQQQLSNETQDIERTVVGKSAT